MLRTGGADSESTVPRAKKPAIGSGGVNGSESIRGMVGCGNSCVNTVCVEAKKMPGWISMWKCSARKPVAISNKGTIE